MLSQTNAIPTIGVKNLEVARQFYEKKLGFTAEDSDMSDHVLKYKSGDTFFEVYESEFAGTNKATALSFEVSGDLEKEVDELRKKGVEFEHYTMPDTKLEGDIHVMGDFKVAWFKDPDGNIICIANQH